MNIKKIEEKKNIINNNVLLNHIRRITQEEVQKIIPKNELDSLWKYLNKINERLKILEE